MSKTFTGVYKLFKIKKNESASPFQPQTNGSLERSHWSLLAEYLRYYVDKDLNNWDELYGFFVHNSTEHSSTTYPPYTFVLDQTS